MPLGGMGCKLWVLIRLFFVLLVLPMDNAVVVLIGAGGHAASVIDALQCAASICIWGMLDSDAGREPINGVQVLGDDFLLPELKARGVSHFAVTVGSAGYAPVRRRLFEAALACGLAPLTVRHPAAIVSPMAVVGAGAQLLGGSVVGAGARIGANCIVNSGAIVEHHCRIGDHVHVASGACLTGGVQVGAESFVGARAVVRQGIMIGSGCTVGMGSVVTRSVESGQLVYGVPAKVI